MSQDTPSFSPMDLIAASGHVGYQWDLRADRLMWCGSWQTLFGANCPAPPGNAKEFATTVLPNDLHLIFDDTAPIFDREYRLRAPDGSLLWVHEHGTTDFEGGRAVRQQGLLRAIEGSSQHSGSTYTSPDRDPLTGRPNRACLLAIVEKILKGPRDIRNKTAYLVVGIDKLAFVNEAMGTKAGDQLICAVADRLNGLCPTRAIVGRTSGDVFGILLPGMAGDVPALAKAILTSFHDHAISAPEVSLHLSVSIGSLAFAQSESVDAKEIMIRAEQALLEASNAGRGRHVSYIESEQRGEQNRAILEIGEKVKQALKSKTLRLAFQPVVNAQTGQIEFYEVLARLFDKNGHLITAADFIPAVEHLGLAPDFDRHVLDLSIQELAACDTLRLAVNISGITAALPDWPGYVQSKLAARPDVAGRLIIEITENAAVLDIAKIRCLVDSLCRMGSQVALDDFGAGSTSIRHLRDLSLAIMKIDRDLLNNILTSPEQQHLVRMITSMAHGLGLRTVAEGIETEEVAVWLRNEKVDMLQGYHLGRPSLERPWIEAAKEAAENGTPFSATVSSSEGASACV